MVNKRNTFSWKDAPDFDGKEVTHMQSSLHTRGPWTVQRSDRKGAQTVIESNGYGAVARLVRQGLPSDEPNARLIAAAPELLEALGEAIIQAQGDALKLGGSVHGRRLQSLADKWTAVFNKATT